MVIKQELEWIDDNEDDDTFDDQDIINEFLQEHDIDVDVDADADDSDKIILANPDKCIGITKNSFNIVAGSTNSGKTNLILNILRKNYKQWNKIYFVCPTLNLQSQYKGIVHPSRILTSEKDIDKLLNDQQKNPKCHIAIVLDDCIGTVSFQSSKIFDKLASSCRHYRITCFILIQDLKKLSPTIRDNSATLFITKLKEHSLRCAFELSSNFPNYQSFKEFIEKACKDYQVVKMNLAAGYDNDINVFKPPLISHKIKFK